MRRQRDRHADHPLHSRGAPPSAVPAGPEPRGVGRMAGPAESASLPDDGAPIGIVCGAGSMPLAAAGGASRRGGRVLLLGLRGFADPQIERYPSHWVALGQLGRIFRLLRAAGCRDVVFIGALVRPSFGRIPLDWTTLRLLPRLAGAVRGGGGPPAR